MGRRNQKKDRRLRVYDKRGYNRFEAELRGDWAKAVARELARRPPGQWPELAVGYVAGMVDFVNRSADQRADRCPPLPWWAEFVGGVERIRNLPEEDRRKTEEDRKRHAVGLSEGRIQRCAKTLWPILEAFGAEYLAKRIRYFAEPKITDEHRALAELLKPYRYCGLAGLTDEPPADDIPF